MVYSIIHIFYNMDYSFKTYDNDQQRKASLIVAALGNEAAVDDDGKCANNYTGFSSLIDKITALFRAKAACS